MCSGQTIATSAEVTPNGGLVMESPNPLNSGLGIILICPDLLGPPIRWMLIFVFDNFVLEDVWIAIFDTFLELLICK